MKLNMIFRLFYANCTKFLVSLSLYIYIVKPKIICHYWKISVHSNMSSEKLRLITLGARTLYSMHLGIASVFC
jgi:hypothetical protein